jgi:hypothetical protein
MTSILKQNTSGVSPSRKVMQDLSALSLVGLHLIRPVSGIVPVLTNREGKFCRFVRLSTGVNPRYCGAIMPKASLWANLHVLFSTSFQYGNPLRIRQFHRVEIGFLT